MVFCEFWNKYPGLYYGCVLLLGFAFGLTANFILLVPLTLLLLVKKKIIYALVLFGASYGYIQWNFQSESLPENGLEGTACFEVQNITKASNHFSSSYVYKGTLHSFTHSKIKNQNCSLFVDDKLKRIPGGKTYLFEGRLFENKKGNYFLKINEKKPWRELEQLHNLSETRFSTKAHIKEHIFSKYSHFHTASFLTGMFTGEIQDPILQFSLSRLGLQHLLAISGFHFSILIWMLSFALRPFFSPKKTALFLIILSTLYFLFIGPNPSVTRAWVATLIFLFAQLLEKESASVNRLGLALIIVLVIDPFSLLQMGFQLSFIATAGILLLYPIISDWLNKILEKRTLSQALELRVRAKFGLILLSFFKEAIALNLAVHLATLPLLLLFFQKFPLYSLIYNMSIPFLVTFSMLLLLLGLFFDLFFLGTIFHTINEKYTDLLLKLIMNAPKKLEFVFNATLSQNVVILYITLLFTLSILWSQSKNREPLSFKYI